MIVLNVTYKCKPDMREEFLEMIMAEGKNGRMQKHLQCMENSRTLQG